MGGVTIKNAGDGQQAGVTPDGQLKTQSESMSLEHYISRFRGQVYQAQFFDAGIEAGENVVGLLVNDSPTLSAVISLVRLQVPVVAGGTALGSNIANYWTIELDEAYDSGGAAVLPVNIHRGIGTAAAVSAYDTNPTLAGAGVEIDRLYPSDSNQYKFDKDNSLILGSGESIALKLTTDNTSGTAYGSIRFMMMDLTT